MPLCLGSGLPPVRVEYCDPFCPTCGAPVSDSAEIAPHGEEAVSAVLAQAEAERLQRRAEEAARPVVNQYGKRPAANEGGPLEAAWRKDL